MNPKNILKLLKDVFEHPVYDFDSIITTEERHFASSLESLIKDAINDHLLVETFDTLAYEHENKRPDPVIVEEEFDNDFEEKPAGDTKKAKVPITTEYKTRAVEFWRQGKIKSLSLKTVQHRFKKVKHLQQLYRWEQPIKDGGSRLEKLHQVSTFVLQKFERATGSALSIHDLDIMRWAIEARGLFDIPKLLFTASPKWIYNFKLRHKIVSRKINKFVTQKSIDNIDTIKQSAVDFVQSVRSELKEIDYKSVFNTDQSGFNLEMHSGRTMAFQGTAKVECLAQSLNSLTHSYTIQPVISARGSLLSPLYVVLQEKDGKFGPTVQKTLYSADNIHVSASTSGKLTSKLVCHWFEKVYLPQVGTKSVLLLDSWSGQTEQNFETIDKGEKELKLLKIPAGTTGMIQPLDVYLFRPWKNFVKHFSDLVIVNNYEINLHLRNNILKLQSLTPNQFSSPRFSDMIKYAWHKSGYIDEKPPKSSTPKDYCFKNCGVLCDSCNKIAIFRCAWCTKSKCIQHFFDPQYENQPHFCEKFVEQ